MATSWDSLYCQIICPIYEIYGGDCADLGCESNPAGAASTVIDEYNTNGIPSGMSNLEKCGLLGYLKSLEDHLALPGNTLPSQTTADLNTMIASMRVDIGPVPGCSN